MQQLESARQELVRLRQELNTVRARLEALQEEPSGITQEAADLRVQQAVKGAPPRGVTILHKSSSGIAHKRLSRCELPLPMLESRQTLVNIARLLAVLSSRGTGACVP